jgi:hypothetical protein
VLDALRLGFEVIVLEDGIKGLDKSEEALVEMKTKGARLLRLEYLTT